MEMEKKYGVYLCKGCGIAEAMDFESLTKVIKKEGKIQHIKEADIMCSPEGRAMILEDMKPEGEGINALVIAACSPRVKYEELDFPNVLVERCNIRELVAWTQEPKNEAHPGPGGRLSAHVLRPGQKGRDAGALPDRMRQDHSGHRRRHRGLERRPGGGQRRLRTWSWWKKRPNWAGSPPRCTGRRLPATPSPPSRSRWSSRRSRRSRIIPKSR